MANKIKGNATIGSVSKTAESGYVNIGGVLKPIVEAYDNIGGVWKSAWEVGCMTVTVTSQGSGVQAWYRRYGDDPWEVVVAVGTYTYDIGTQLVFYVIGGTIKLNGKQVAYANATNATASYTLPTQYTSVTVKFIIDTANYNGIGYVEITAS